MLLGTKKTWCIIMKILKKQASRKLNRVGKKTEDKKMSLKWYLCKECKVLLKKDSNPASYGCAAASFHNWNELANVGNINYQCKECGIVIQADGNPTSYGCTAASFHNWNELSKVGDKSFQCKECGIVIQADSNPTSYGCTAASFHNWNEL